MTTPAPPLGVGEICYQTCTDATCVVVPQQNCQVGLVCVDVVSSATLRTSRCVAGCDPSLLVTSGYQVTSGHVGCTSGATVDFSAHCEYSCGSRANCQTTGTWDTLSPCASSVTATPITTPSSPSSDSATDKDWFWPVIVAVIVVVLCIVFGLCYKFVYKRKNIFNAEGEHDAIPFGKRSPPGRKQPPLISALKGSPGPKSPRSPLARKRGVTFSDYHPGDVVEVHFKGEWHPAQIRTHDPDGTYTITWLPSGKEAINGVSPGRVRPKTANWSTPPATSEYYESYDPTSADQHDIQCIWQNSWHTGRLEAINPDGTYLIRWPDGSYTPNMDPADTKPL
eukprot:TRINITY_DN6207_c1_g1_i1.p1 TRINITY_DN6207_c1_g1~~TRINITY_DN6207_c1_g1_i1.p1  ORF type:complete len:338 (+),score=39.00 TRINITY_DN6207_c1_g1_i1:78-1091(+)